MDITHLIAFNLTLLASMASPGPALLFALKQSLSGGLVTGIVTGAGLGLMASVWTGIALLGLDAIFAVFPWAYVTLKVVGAAYLIWIAIGMWRNARTPVGDATATRRNAFLGGVLVNLANPKSVLFASAVLVVIFPKNLALWEKAAIVGNHFIVEIIVYSLFAALLATPSARRTYLGAKHIFDRTASFVLGALGLRLLLGR